MTTLNGTRSQPNRAGPAGPAVIAMVLGILALILAGSWVEARWPNAAGDYITVTPRGAADATGMQWQLHRLDGVQNVVAVLRGDLPLDETLDTGWSSVSLLANRTDTPALAFLPPDPELKLWQGRLPEPSSADGVVLAYELAQNLNLAVGDELPLRDRSLIVAGIWGPSARLPGNWAQVSAAAAEVDLLSGLDRLLVVPADRHEVTALARRIWQKMPDLQVLSPAWEIARARRERMLLGMVLVVAVAFLLLLAVPVWAPDAAGQQGPALWAALLSGAGGLVLGWAVTTIANVYARNTLGLTPFQVTPRLALAAPGLAGLVWLLGALLPFRRWWSLRSAATVLLLALSGATVVTLGMLNESLRLSLSEAKTAATDWVTLVGIQADQHLLQTLSRISGIRGYVIEANGGLANEDEERWLGPRPSSGVVYGVRVAGGEGTLTVPYRLGYWRGGPLDPEQGGQAVVGYDLALAQGLALGGTVEVRGVPFTVVGIRERLLADHGSEANDRIDISLSDLARVLRQPAASGEMTLLIPPAADQEQKAVFLQELATRLNMGQVRTIEDRLADIARSYPAAWTLTPASASEAVRHAQVSYANAVWLCALFFLASGALAVASTMRDRLGRDEQRMGLLKALGSDEGTLLGEYLQLAAALGVVGGLLGVCAGWAAGTCLNLWGPAGSPQLIFTPRLASAVFFVVAVTPMLAAVAPATDAVRQDTTGPLYPRQVDGGAGYQASLPGNAVQGGCVS